MDYLDEIITESILFHDMNNPVSETIKTFNDECPICSEQF